MRSVRLGPSLGGRERRSDFTSGGMATAVVDADGIDRVSHDQSHSIRVGTHLVSVLRSRL